MKVTDFSLYQHDFREELKFRGMSGHTQEAYHRDLKQLFSLLTAAKTALKKEELDRTFFTWALKKLSAQGQKPSTMARKVSVWRQYNHYLNEHGVTAENFFLGLKLAKIPAHLPKAISAQELNQLFDFPVTSKGPKVVTAKRDQAMFELMYGSGLRVAEVSGLNVEDIELAAGWVTVRGKGGKTRQVPMTEKSLTALKDYLSLRQSLLPEAPLFISERGTRITTRRIEQALNEWGKKRGAQTHLTPHRLRHSFATQILQNSQNIRAVQELLGHSQLSTTQIYTKLDFEHLAAVYQRAHPRAKKKD